jgi:nucleoside 2-deoxyribosyltransferase
VRRIYLAAPYARREQMKAHRGRLHDAGHEVVSSWIDLTIEETHATPYELGEMARTDLAEIDDCDTLVLFAGETTKSHGRQVEFGYALAKEKQLFLVGPPENIFHVLPHVFTVRTLDELIAVWK